jgi:hypothetical protein
MISQYKSLMNQQLIATWFCHTWIYITIWVQQTNCGYQHGEDTTKVPYRLDYCVVSNTLFDSSIHKQHSWECILTLYKEQTWDTMPIVLGSTPMKSFNETIVEVMVFVFYKQLALC